MLPHPRSSALPVKAVVEAPSLRYEPSTKAKSSSVLGGLGVATSP